MGMYALIEDEHMKALEAANSWHQTLEAQALLEKIDAFERESDRWCGELPDVAKAFKEAADDAEGELEMLRSNAVNAAADTYSTDRQSDEWQDAWEAADEDAPPASQAIQSARRNHVGNSYLEMLAA